MHRRHQYGVTTTPLPWPGRDVRHAGVLDFGLIGGASFNPDKQSWAFARDMQESTFEGDRITDVSLLHEIIAESGYEDYKLSYYDPFVGNLCAVGRFMDLPIVVTPEGRTGADLSISLVLHKPQLQPPFNFLAPKSTLISFVSAINQVTTPFPGSLAAGQEEQILVRTNEYITIVAPAENVPTAISRVYHNYIRVLAQIPIKPSSCTDRTIHAAISPYSSNTYALIGDKGRVATWSRSLVSSVGNTSTDMDDDDDTGKDITDNVGQGSSFGILGSSNITIVRGEDASGNNIDDPWRSCAWGAHPCQLMVASRQSLDLIDFRGSATQTCLFTPRTGETIQAIQEDKTLKLAPFQTYIATSHQIACIDQRFTKRPVISWAHQMDRAMPCGIKAMDLTSGGSNYSTVLTWSKRNADITAYNVSLGSNEREPEPMVMKGRAQELPSFQSHTQYTNSSSLRDPLKRFQFSAGADNVLQQAIKPPLLGLALLPNSMFNDDEDPNENDLGITRTDASVSKFSLVQYAFTGAVYAQEFEIHTKGEIESENSNVEKDSILTADYHQGLFPVDAASENALISSIAHDMIANERLEEEEIIDSLFEAVEDHVAPWKQGVKEAQEQADDVVVSMTELRLHVDLDLQSLLAKLRKYMLIDREASTNRWLVDVNAKVEEAMNFINNSTCPGSMFDILQAIKCISVPSSERSAIAKQIQQNIELDPYVTTDDGNIAYRRIRKAWPITNLKIDTLIRASEPDVEALTSYLKDLYPLPESVMLQPDQARMNEKAITNQLANLTIPESNEYESDMDEVTDQQYVSEGDVWPTQETRLIRSRTIRRLAQDLILASIVVIKTFEPETTSAQSTIEHPSFQYLFQNRRHGDSISSAPKIKLPSKCKPILNEWKVGEDPANYVYKLPEAAMNDVGISEDEEDLEEIKEHEERMIQLRQRREKREEKVKSARRNDSGYNVNSGGSLSQPTGIIAEPLSYNDFYDEADEDGLFSLPTVVSASQPASFRTSLLSRPQSQQKPRPKSISTPKNPALGASLPTTKLKKDRSIIDPSPTHSPVRATFQSTSLASSEGSTLVENNFVIGSARSLDQSSSQSLSQSQNQSQSQSQSQDGGFLWGASQPVRGAFATRRVAGPASVGAHGSKPKKKKSRTQGF
ncbi:hypothetical protein BGX27_009232 [Mortierella sp. AM989]|nr:hypothetical protein BGX27_009232 [Mortierella sp. AM989]